MAAKIKITGASLTPNPVEAGGIYKISVEIQDIHVVLADEDGAILADGDGALLAVTDDIIALLSDEAGYIVDDDGAFIEDMEV